MQILKAIRNYLNDETTAYSHRNRTIEIVALEQGIDIDLLKQETKAMIASEGRIETIGNLKQRFRLPVSAVWRFVDKVDKK